MFLLAIVMSFFAAAGAGGQEPSEVGDSASAAASVSFPEVSFEIGTRLPNFMLPRAEGGAPVALYDLLGGKPTLLHIYASW